MYTHTIHGSLAGFRRFHSMEQRFSRSVPLRITRDPVTTIFVTNIRADSPHTDVLGVLYIFYISPCIVGSAH